MQFIKELWHDIRASVHVGMTHWRYVRRHLRRGGNPDVEAF